MRITDQCRRVFRQRDGYDAHSSGMRPIISSLFAVSMVKLLFKDNYLRLPGYSFRSMVLVLISSTCLTGLFASNALADEQRATPALLVTPSSLPYLPSNLVSKTKPTTDNAPDGLAIFRIDDSRWFDVTIDLGEEPQTAQEVEEERNKDTQLRKAGRSGSSRIFPDTDEIIDGIRLRFHYLFD